MREMTVFNLVITREQQQAALDCMRGMGRFVAADIEKVLVSAGVPERRHSRTGMDPIAMRATDRLIQRARKDGLIEFKARVWVWTYRAVAFDDAPTPTGALPHEDLQPRL